MNPVPFTIPVVGWPIRAYGLMIVIGFLLATWLASREARRRGLPEIVYDLGVVMLISGLIGGRVFFYVEFYDEQFARLPWYHLFAIWEGGLVFYGGAIAGALGGFAFLVWKRAPVADLLDAVAPFIPIAMGFGRLGCFLNGCCWGGRCSADFPLGVRYPRAEEGLGPGALEQQISEGLIPPDASHSLPVYPVQLYETGLDFLMFALLWWYSRGPAPRGGGMPLLFVLYGLGRWSLELLRGDNEPVLLSMTISQVVAACLVAVFLPIFVALWWRGLRVPPGAPASA